MLEAILETAVGAIITINSRAIILSINPATQRMFGYTAEELVGRNVNILMPEDVSRSHDGYISHHLQTGDRRIIGVGRDVEGKRKNGVVFPIHLSVSAFEVDGEKYFTGIIHDLSMRVELQAEVDRQISLFQAVFDHVPEPLVITDTNNKILMINPATSYVFRFDPNELIGKNAEILLTDDDKPSISAAEVKNLNGLNRHAARPIDVSLRRKSGDPFPGRIASSTIPGPAGKTAGILRLIRDLTLEHKQEEALLKTQRIEAIGQLTGGVAHDFNNLLTIISGNLELLEDYLVDERGAEHLRRAKRAAEAGARLTNRLLTFARRRRFNSQLVRLNIHVLAMTELLHRTLGENIQLDTNLTPDLWTTLIDPSEIESALLNLAINARDAMPNGGKLVIETSNSVLDTEATGMDSTVTPGEYVRLSVSDNGTGMSHDVLQHAFEPFFTTKPPGRGTGLGLSTIYGFIKQSNGHIVVYSEPGSGTTVNLYLPRYVAPEDVNSAEEPVKARGSAKGETILVVEDNPDVRAITIGRLDRLGYNVVEVETARDAIKLLTDGLDVDGIFSDVVMPGGYSGFDLARWVAEHRPHIAMLLTSGFAEGVAPGADDEHPTILRKPYSLAELAAEMEKTLDQRVKR